MKPLEPTAKGPPEVPKAVGGNPPKKAVAKFSSFAPPKRKTMDAISAKAKGKGAASCKKKKGALAPFPGGATVMLPSRETISARGPESISLAQGAMAEGEGTSPAAGGHSSGSCSSVHLPGDVEMGVL